MSLYLIVTGDFVTTGGMDRANHALASYLARRGDEVHLVAHRVGEDLLAFPNVTFHRAPKPAGAYLLGAPLLDRVGRYWAKRISALGGRVIVNGGNCRWADVNWVHYVHSTYSPEVSGAAHRRLKSTWAHHRFVAAERTALPQARIVIANSKRTASDLTSLVGVLEERVHIVHYGCDPDAFRPATPDERGATRARLGWPTRQPVVAFVGALGDRRKGFDTLFKAWTSLCASSDWDANLAVIGAGAELRAWRGRAIDAGISSRIDFLGFRQDVPEILAACDSLAAPSRYEAYGLGVQEALCCGLPAIVSGSAGIAERYPPELSGLLLRNPDDAVELAHRLQVWRAQADAMREPCALLSAELRRNTWTQAMEQIVAILEGAAERANTATSPSSPAVSNAMVDS